MLLGDKPIFLSRQIKIKTLRDYILDAGLTDVDTIVMHQADFDEIALEYKQTYNDLLPYPYLLIGLLIREEIDGSLRQGCIRVIENDKEPLRVNLDEIFDSNKVLHRCADCGSFISPDGEELDLKEFNKISDYLKKFGDKVHVRPDYGKCCRAKWEPKPYPFSSKKFEVDYTVIEGKDLMGLTENDFEEIGLSKGSTTGFEIIYSCRNARNSKIYFTPNERSYAVRGYMLEEYEEIFTTDQLIAAIRKWRND